MIRHSHTLRMNAYLLAILALAVAARVVVALYLGDVVVAPPLLTDQLSYHTLAIELIAGHGFSFPVGWYPFTPPHTPTAHWSFLYSLFVAAVYAAFGVHPLAVRLVQAVLGGVLLPWLVYRLARTLLRLSRGESITTGEPESDGVIVLVPLVAAFLAAVYAYFVLYAATLMTETLFIAGVLWSLEQALTFAARPAVPFAARLGLALGLTTLLRQSILPWMLVMCAWLLLTSISRQQVRRVLGGLLIAAGIMALMILPFTVRNYRVYGTFLLLNSNSGYAMYSAQHPMQGTTFQEYAAAPVPADLAGLNEAQMDRELMRRGIQFVVADPRRYLLLSLSRVWAFVDFLPNPGTSLLHNLGRLGSFGLFLPFMLYGLWLSLRMSRVPGRPLAWRTLAASPVALLLLFMLFYSLLHILTWAMPRYRLPVDAVAMTFAALAFSRLLERVTSMLPGKLRLRARAQAVAGAQE